MDYLRKIWYGAVFVLCRVVFLVKDATLSHSYEAVKATACAHVHHQSIWNVEDIFSIQQQATSHRGCCSLLILYR